MTETKYKFHPACLALPPMKPADFDKFVEIVRKDGGLTDPVETYQGLIIDGRHRLEACEKLGFEPKFKEWNGKKPNGEPCSVVDYVMSKNLDGRRHLDPSQRAAVAADLVPLYESVAQEQSLSNLKQGAGPPSPSPPTGGVGKTSGNGASTARAAKSVGASQRGTERAKRVKAQAPPEVFDAVKEGRMSLHAAEQTIDPPEGALDLEGRPVPPALRQVFADAISGFGPLIRSLRDANIALEKLLDSPAGKHLPKDMSHRIDTLLDQVRNAQPKMPCPVCPPEKPAQSCKWCAGAAWLTKQQAERCTVSKQSGLGV